jgi:methionyl-tRNA formyltransferase
MRIVFMGTAELACPVLESVAKRSGHDVVSVVTQPDRPKGRELALAAPPVKVAALKLGLPVLQPPKVREMDAVCAIRDFRPDLIVVVAYGQILPRHVLEIPRLGCLNVHTSLLPRWRGAAPIQYAILAGDRETGVTTMYMNEKMDEGDIILQRSVTIGDGDTAATLHDRLALVGADLAVETVQLLADGRAPRIRQDETQVTYAHKISKEQGHIDWRRPVVEIERQVRAFNPWPSAYFFAGDLMVKVWKAVVAECGSGLSAGSVTGDRLIATGRGALCPVEVQPAGKKRMGWEDFLRGHQLPVGTILQ